MMDPIAILADGLAQRGIAHIAPASLAAILHSLGLTVTGGARQAVDTHLAEVKRLSDVARSGLRE